MEQRKKKAIIISVIAFLIVFIVLPVILYWFVDQYDFIKSNIVADNWLMFWATYLAGILGGLATLVAMVYTLKSAYEQQKEERADRDKEIAEERKYQYAPYLVAGIVEEQKNMEDVCKYIYRPNTDIGKLNAQTTVKHEQYVEIKNIGSGLATNIFFVYDGSYVANGSMYHYEEDFLLKECFHLAAGDSRVCDIKLYIENDLYEKTNKSLSGGISLDILCQDMLGNIIKKTICFSLEEKYVYSEGTPQYLKIDELKNMYPHVKDIEKMFLL